MMQTGLVTGIKYDSTCRDDGNYTKMPVIPWLEPSINGIRYGAMIHPTTNRKVSEKHILTAVLGQMSRMLGPFTPMLPSGRKWYFDMISKS